MPDTPAQTPHSPDFTSSPPVVGSIMLVDDNVQNLELLQAYLEELGCPIRTATDGQEALDLVAKDQPDIILLDIMLPRMSGFQICKKIKGSAETRGIPIIMVTALNEVSDVERAVECGADDFLTKPVNRLELLTRVRSLLRVRNLQRELDRTLAEMRRIVREEPDRSS
ncbi:MAG: response regulator [Planctomycetes bacterium]|nr:response regulator [Planctomycetota bacterium]MCH9057704.1 response regulator [Planctomycetota bacterium]